MKIKKVEALALTIAFGCKAKGECKRNFVCINPEFQIERVCPDLIAYDHMKQLVQKGKTKNER